MPANSEISGLAHEKVEILAKLLDKQGGENLLHGLFQIMRACEEARFGSVAFHFVAGKLKSIETRETFQASK